jgi:phosphoribosylformimino-5-aminoimidazole carboxamide ribotide isomerase
MLLIPAIELKGGKCVRKPKGKAPAAVYSEDPAALARQWVKAGARRLHVLDLDSVASGKPAQAAELGKIVAACPGVPVQVAGGMRSEEAVQAYMEAGVEFVVLGTRAVTASHLVNDLCLEYPGHVIVSLESKDGKVATEGWSKLADADVVGAAEHFQREGAAAILHSALGHGNEDGAHLTAAVLVARAVTIPVISAGGVANLADVRALCGAGQELLGALVGEPLQDGLDLTAAQKLADSLAAKV